MKDRALDRASRFTLQYLDMLQHLLKIEFTDSGAPIFVPDRLNHIDIQKLRACISDLHTSKLKEDAIGDMQSYGTKKPHKIQTTAVGYADSFDLQVKLGLLLGQRLILWDTVLLSVLSQSDHQVDLEKLGEVSNGLVALRPIIQAGDLVLLPQPKTWLERAAKYYRIMPREASVSGTFKGYVNAAALLQEGIVLHPYLMQNQMDYHQTIERLPTSISPYYSAERADYHYSLLRILKSKNLAFLRDVRAAAFYETVSDMSPGMLRQFQKKLAQKLSFPRSGMSLEEKEQWLDEVVAELEELLPTINRHLNAKHLDSGFAGLKALQATFGVIADASSAGAFSAIVSGLSAVGSIKTFLKKTFATPMDPVLVQVFSQLKVASDAQLIKEIQDQMNISGSSGDWHRNQDPD